MRVLIISDEPSAYLYDHFRPENVEGVDMVLSAGDLKRSYLDFIASMVPKPLVYVPGNHDDDFATHPVLGGICADGRVVTVCGLRIAGLGGCMGHNPQAVYQYTEKAMRRRVNKLESRVRLLGGVDIFLTHAPAAGIGDGQDPFHRGFDCFHPFLRRQRPRLHVFGHQHKSYNARGCYELYENGIRHVNACGYRILELD